jgi:hypothetical protein
MTSDEDRGFSRFIFAAVLILVVGSMLVRECAQENPDIVRGCAGMVPPP